ncbi:unnamed protein product, partial [Choristocarpus tenellus]
KAIVNQVFFRQKLHIMDDSALEDAQVSLQNMLRDFLEDTGGDIPEEERAQSVMAMDMSVVSRELERASPQTLRATVSGKIPRMLLIQVAFLKKELLQAMGAIDELFSTTQASASISPPPPSIVILQLISAVPAGLALFIAYRFLRSVINAIVSQRLEPTRIIHGEMRRCVREVERLLTSSR